jgi:hypothetical protein
MRHVLAAILCSTPEISGSQRKSVVGSSVALLRGLNQGALYRAVASRLALIASAVNYLESAVLDPGLPIRYDRPINVSSLKIGNSAIISCGQDA